MNGARCAWMRLIDETPVCDQTAAYRAYYHSCARCGQAEGQDGCAGAPLCVEHAAVQRTHPDLMRMETT